jgi:ubiquinone biosynthesis protein COQ4
MLKALVDLSKDPQSTDNVHYINDSLIKNASTAEQEKFIRLFYEYPEFKERYEEPRSPEFDPEELSRLPHNTLGYHYAKFMHDHDYSVIWYPHMEETSPLIFARNWQYKTHDVLHTVTGFSGKPLDEISLQGFYLGQKAPNPTSMIVLASIAMNRLRTAEIGDNTEVMEHLFDGYQMGKRAKKILFRKWEGDWATDITELRESLQITTNIK